MVRTGLHNSVYTGGEDKLLLGEEKEQWQEFYVELSVQ